MTTRVATTALTAAATATLAAAVTAGSLSGGTSPAEARSATPHTRVTLSVTGCEGCDLRLTQALDGHEQVWQSTARTVEDGTVSWRIPTRRTHGISITVDAPWDGGPGYVPTVAFRYGGEQVGDEVTPALARTKRRASTCWAGTDARAATLPITVVHARSTNPPGDPIRTPRAFTSVTQDWMKPMERAWKGITGTQDVGWCG
ncbi:hypothetical protein [Nocardioides sp.]|uniref:hypothetical protein n=1 Tax=Nocardioides sp. TaxID=35761 RepID=UPI0025D1B61F|nr:hypothetical protein [Nocardioides sp.]